MRIHVFYTHVSHVSYESYVYIHLHDNMFCIKKELLHATAVFSRLQTNTIFFEGFQTKNAPHVPHKKTIDGNKRMWSAWIKPSGTFGTLLDPWCFETHNGPYLEVQDT